MTFDTTSRGMFWLPEEPIPSQAFAPDTAVAGTLKIDQDGRSTFSSSSP
jgi:hypothetical protein